MGTSFWSDRRVFLTGGSGFLGTAIRELLARRSAAAMSAPSSSDLDLRDAVATRAFVKDWQPNLVIHGAAVVGGIGANQRSPGRFFYENAIMGIHLIEECRRAGVDKFVCMGTVCSYPKFAPVPFREDDLWNGYPEETNAAYGIAKKALLAQLQAYRTEYKFNGIFLLPVNLYGPGDSFDLETSHVIPAMVRKFVDAAAQGLREVVLWGDGSPTREFLYIDDAAEAVLLAAENYDGPEPVNLGSGEEIAISELARKIAALTAYDGAIIWDSSRPNGQPRRRVDSRRAERAFGFRARTPLDEGLTRTIAWYRNARTQVATV